MNKIFGRLAILAVLTFGIFFIGSDTAKAAYAPKCQQCYEVDSECALYCEDGQNAPGCAWCIRKSEQCWSLCRW